MGEGSIISTDPQHTPTFIQPSPQPQKTQKPRKPKRNDTQVPQPSNPTECVADEAVHMELGDILVRAATIASSLEAEQDNGNTLQSDKDRLKLDELMALCITLQTRVLDLEQTKITQHNEIVSLKRKVKNLKGKNRSRTHRLKRLYKVGLTARVESSGNEESLGEDVFVADQEATNEIEVVKEAVEVINIAKLIFVAAQLVAAGDIVSAASAAITVSAATTTAATNVDDITLAQALKELKTTKPKMIRVVIQEPVESTTTISSQLSLQQSLDKGKGIWIEPVKPLKKKDLIRLDEETALNWWRAKKREQEQSWYKKNPKKQNVEDDKETLDLKQLMEIIPEEEEVAIDAIPLAVKSPNLHVGREEVSPCTIYTFKDVGKEAYD
ncbi:hypothetical protein Tco_0727462 [Tanacetum coccineum]|uniref:Uncharacterized protein n=1 Tax=Tanacetum coccineum TaxID=301880 RepID=A0ABQ4YKS2_9ASTR